MSSSGRPRRLLRNRRERAAAIELFGRQRVGILTVKGADLDLSTAYGRGMAGLLGEFDTMETEVEKRAGRGGGRGPGPQRPAERITRLRLDRRGSRQARGVRRAPGAGGDRPEVTRRLLAGESLAGVTADLNARRVPGPIVGTWGKSSVRKIAVRPSNAALRIHHRGRWTEQRYEGTWPALVGREEWERVTALLTNPARSTNGHVARPGDVAIHPEEHDPGPGDRLRQRGPGRRDEPTTP